jgi:hypothetical protein
MTANISRMNEPFWVPVFCILFPSQLYVVMGREMQKYSGTEQDGVDPFDRGKGLLDSECEEEKQKLDCEGGRQLQSSVPSMNTNLPGS